MTKQRIAVDDVIELHVAAFLASCTRLALKLQDRSHLNAESKDWNDEAELADHHRRQAFLAKNVLHEANRELEKVPTT